MIVPTKSKDGGIIYSFDLDFIPTDSSLYTILSNQTGISEKDSDENIILYQSLKDINLLYQYLKFGQVEIDHIKNLVLMLNFYLISRYNISYDVEFYKIKLEEDWFRRNLYNPYFKDKELLDQHYKLIKWSNLSNEVFELASYLPFKSYKIIEMVDEEYKTVKTNSSYEIDILNPDQKSEEYPSDKYLVSFYHMPTFRLKFKYENNLDKITKITQEKFKQRNDDFDNQLLNSKPQKMIWKTGYYQIIDYNKYFTFYLNPTFQHQELFEGFDWNNVVVAGGSVLKSVLKIENRKDIDLFIYGLNSIEEYNKKIYYIIEFIQTKHLLHSIYINDNCITIKYIIKNEVYKKIQIILRTYKTKSEIIHGFDVDSSCILYDGSNFWVTERFKYSLTYLVNTIDYDRMSPSYEARLRKYNQLGFSIHIPGFNPNLIKENIKELYELFERFDYIIREYIDDLEGIDLLLAYFIINSRKIQTDYNLKSHSNWIQKFNLSFDDKNYPEKDIEIDNIDLGLKENIEILVGVSILTGPNSMITYSLNNLDKTNQNRRSDPVFIDILIRSIQKFVKINWKTIQPGEQFTGTFHKTVYRDWKNWYPRKYYPRP